MLVLVLALEWEGSKGGMAVYLLVDNGVRGVAGSKRYEKDLFLVGFPSGGYLWCCWSGLPSKRRREEKMGELVVF